MDGKERVYPTKKLRIHLISKEKFVVISSKLLKN